MESFRDTHIFQHMSDATSMKTQFILSPYIADFNVGSQLKMKQSVAKRMTTYRS